MNSDLSNGPAGWEAEGGAASFHFYRSASGTGLTTYGANKEADRGRLYQCFQVPANATELQFMLSGGADSANLYVALWNGGRLARKDDGPQRQYSLPCPLEYRGFARQMRHAGNRR